MTTRQKLYGIVTAIILALSALAAFLRGDTPAPLPPPTVSTPDLSP